MATAPFAPFEWMIAWRYLRAKRAEGGVSVMTWISLLGVTLAVFALIATLAVRSGFREEFVDTILGANAHVTVYQVPEFGPQGQEIRTISDADAMAERIARCRASPAPRPLVKGPGHGHLPGPQRGAGGLRHRARGPRRHSPRSRAPRSSRRHRAVPDGHRHRLRRRAGARARGGRPSPHHLARGARTPDGRLAPRLGLHRHLHLHRRALRHRPHPRLSASGAEAQTFFNRDGVADEIEVMVADPDNVEALAPAILQAAGPAPWSGPGRTPRARSCRP
jgi:lipoprotein-releasing system permease protein